MYDSPHITNRIIEVGGLPVFLRYSDGDGPAVVLLQGGMLDSSTLTWRPVLEALPPRYRVFAPDLPGYGRSAAPADARYTTEYYIDFLADFLDVLGLARVHLFGSSMSAAVAMGYALRHPAGVASLGLAGAYGWQPRVPLHEAAYLALKLPGLAALGRRVLRAGRGVMTLALRVAVGRAEAITPQFVEDARAGLRAEHALDAFLAWLRTEIGRHRVRTNYADRLPELGMPAILLHGARDWILPAVYARRAHAQMPHAHLHLFAEGGHMIPREYPDEVNRLITEFLAEVETGAV